MPKSFPYSPRFIVAQSNVIKPDFELGKPQTHSHESMDKVFDEGSVDIDRRSWTIGDEVVESVKGKGIENIDILKEKSKSIDVDGEPLNFTHDEAKAVYAFSVSTNQKWTQGGIFNGYWWFVPLNFQSMEVALASSAPEMILNRNEADEDIIEVGSDKKIYHINYEGEEIESDTPIITCHYDYQVKPIHGEDGSIYAAEVNKEDYKFEIDDKIWEETILPAAFKMLGSLGSFEEDQLTYFIPYLTDANFAKFFAEKLAQQTPENIKLANYLIALNFYNRPDDLMHIEKALENTHTAYYLRSTTSLMQMSVEYQKHLEAKIKNDFSVFIELVKSPDAGEELDKLRNFSNKEVAEYLRSHPNFLEQLETKTKEDEGLKKVYQGLIDSLKKMDALDKVTQASFDNIAITDNKTIVGNFAEQFYKNDKNIFEQNKDATEAKILHDFRGNIRMLASPQVVIPKDKMILLKDQRKQVFTELQRLIDHIKASTDPKEAKDLVYHLERGLHLLKSATHSQRLKEELHNFNNMIENLPPKLIKGFTDLPKINGLDWVNGETALDQFQDLSKQAVKILFAEKEYAVTANNVEVQKFNIEAERLSNETDEAVMHRVAKKYLGTFSGVIGEMSSGEPLGGLTEKITWNEFNVCKIETDAGTMGYIEFQKGNEISVQACALPSEYLPENIWLNNFGSFKNKMQSYGFDPQAITEDLYNEIFRMANEKQKPWQDNKLQEIIVSALDELGMKQKTQDIAKFLAKEYIKERDRVLYDAKTGFPNDDLIRLNMSQIDKLLTVKPDGPVVIQKAYSEAMVKAVMLHALAQGLDEKKIINASKFQDVKMPSKNEVKDYLKYLNTRGQGFEFHSIPGVNKELKEFMKQSAKLTK